MKIVILDTFCAVCSSAMEAKYTVITTDEGTRQAYLLHHIVRPDCPNSDKTIEPPVIEVAEL